MSVAQSIRRLLRPYVQRGKRGVLLTQPTANLGNFLYEWQYAWHARRSGEDVVCLVTPKMEPWLPVFGEVARPLVVRPEQVRLTDRRLRTLHNEFGVHFGADQIAAFAEGFFGPSGVIGVERVPADQRLTERDVLVNVRRGDYFSVEAHRRSYAFDLDEYLAAALALARETGGPIERIHVVSDGIDWCRANLGWLAGECGRLTYEDRGLAPETHLAILANAPRLILTNSTFSYWGGYLSAWLTERPEWVVAPWFHTRDHADGAAWQLDPRWSIVRDIPSGWALPES